jgi:diaminopimelate epimerase
MYFWKMNGAGNDFIVVNNIKEQIPESRMPDLARKLCHRHLSIGGDGVMFVEQAADADISMRIFNADGSEAEMCGNGLRCIARYAWEEKLADNPINVQTKAGAAVAQRLSKREYKTRLQGITLVKNLATVTVNGREYTYTYVEIGNPGLPHIVVPVNDLQKQDRQMLHLDGASLRHHSNFPKGTNVNFCEALDASSVDLLTYERGVENFTYACGTGSGAVAFVLRMQNAVNSDTIKLNVPGGLLRVELVKNSPGNNAEDFDIYLTGDTNIVCKGDITDEDLYFSCIKEKK